MSMLLRFTLSMMWTVLALSAGCEKRQTKGTIDISQNCQLDIIREIRVSVDTLLEAAPTNDLGRVLHGHVPGWKDDNARIRKCYRQPCEVVRAVQNCSERLKVLERMEQRFLDVGKKLTQPCDEINYFLCTVEMLDEISKSVWEASHDALSFLRIPDVLTPSGWSDGP